MKAWMQKGGTLLAGLGLLIALVGWWQYEPLQIWQRVRQLVAASPNERVERAGQVVELGEAALNAVVEELVHPEPGICVNAQLALELWAEQWSPEEAAAQHLAQRLAERYAVFSPAGQRSALVVLTAQLRQEGPTVLPVALTRAAGEVLQAASAEPELRRPVRLLASALLPRVPEGQWLEVCRKLAETGMSDPEPAVRAASVQLLLSGPLRQDAELLPKVVPLLRDPDAEVRRTAILALASAAEQVGNDALLPLLHDPDDRVQHLCETALRSRGLPENHLHLARLISDPSPLARLRVLHYLHHDTDLEPGVWLRRLSQDASPAVRAAAVRAALAQPQADLRDRLREMAVSDPSESVRLNAQFYLGQLAERRPIR